MWACYFSNDELIVSSVRRTQKGSQKRAVEVAGVKKWKAAKDRGIRCHEVIIKRAWKDEHGIKRE